MLGLICQKSRNNGTPILIEDSSLLISNETDEVEGIDEEVDSEAEEDDEEEEIDEHQDNVVF